MPLLLEYQPEIEDAHGLQVEDSVFTPSQDGLARVVVANRSGFTQRAERGDRLGEATMVTEIKPVDSGTNAQAFQLNSHEVPDHGLEKRDSQRREKIRAIVDEINLQDPAESQATDPATGPQQGFLS